MTDKSKADKCDAEDDALFWIVQAASHKGVTPFGVCRVALDARADIIEAIARGAVLDRQGAEWNARVLNMATSSRMTTALAISGRQGKDAEDLMAVLAQTYAAEQRLPVRVPLRLLRIPATRAAEGDIQERVIYQMLHVWDYITTADRRDLLSLCITRETNSAAAAAPLVEMCIGTSGMLVELLFRARSSFVVEHENECPTPQAHGIRQRVVFAQTGRVGMGHGCPCGYDYFMTAVYRAWHARGAGSEISQRLGTVPCPTVQRVLVATLFAVWEGMRAVVLTRRLRALARTMNIALTIPANAHPLLNTTGAPLLIPCTYQPLRQALLVMQRFTTDAARTDWESGFSVPLDGPGLRLFPAGDPVLTRWCDTLRSALSACQTCPAARPELARLLRGWDGGAISEGSLETQTVAAALSFMYYRHVNIRTALTDDDPAPDPDPTWLTFGLTPAPDTLWQANNIKIELFIAALCLFRSRVRERLCSQLIAEPRARPRPRLSKPVAAPVVLRFPTAPPAHRSGKYGEEGTLPREDMREIKLIPWWHPICAPVDILPLAEPTEEQI